MCSKARCGCTAWQRGGHRPRPGGVIPPGFAGEFEVLVPVRKQFVLVDVAG